MRVYWFDRMYHQCLRGDDVKYMLQLKRTRATSAVLASVQCKHSRTDYRTACRSIPNESKCFLTTGPSAPSYGEPGLSRMTSTPPLASAASLAPQQNFPQSNQANFYQQGQGYQQPSQGNYQQQGQGTYPQTSQGAMLQPQQGAFQQPHQGAYQQPKQESYQQPQQGSYQQPNQAKFPQPGQSQPSRQFPGQQNLGPRTPNTSAEDPFAHLPYPVSALYSSSLGHNRQWTTLVLCCSACHVCCLQLGLSQKRASCCQNASMSTNAIHS